MLRPLQSEPRIEEGRAEELRFDGGAAAHRFDWTLTRVAKAFDPFIIPMGGTRPLNITCVFLGAAANVSIRFCVGAGAVNRTSAA